MNKIKFLPTLIMFFALNSVFSQEIDVWEAQGARRIANKSIKSNSQIYTLNDVVFKEILFKAPQRMTTSKPSKVHVNFPLPDGTKEVFEVFEHSVLSKELALKYPNIKSYYARSVKNPLNTIRFSLDDFGFHGMIFHNQETYFINPENKHNKTYFIASKKEFNAKTFGCSFDDAMINEHIEKEISAQQRTVDDGLLRTFRLALACTGEYATFHINAAEVSTGTDDEKKAAVLSAMNTTMTRVNGIYERDMSLTMEIISNNDDIIFLDAATDGYTNDDGAEMMDENQTIITNVIGNDNYDIGHVFSTGGGGIATLNSPCFSDWKARGVTGLPSPVGDVFDVVFVAHEMGHQFGATHTFNNSCDNNRFAGTAVEPGSGSTIMSYAGICAPNVLSQSDDYFHAISLEKMWQNITGGNSTCAETQSTGNTAPIVSGGNDYTIPQGTPFVLEAVGSDTDGDLITYCWEQIDSQIGTMPPVSNAASGPIFRSRPPSNLPTRYFPRTSDLLANNLSPTWEVIPTVSRNMNFSVLVRDNNVLGGQTARDDVLITVDDSGPFQVTSHSTVTTLNAGEITTINWDVANTNAAPVNASLVDIYFVVDNDFENLVLVDQNVVNDGSHNLSIPSGITSSQVRIMVKAVDNVFFALNSEYLTIQQSEFVLNFDAIEFSVCQPNDIVFNFTYNTFVGFSETVTFSANNVPSGLIVSFNPTTASTDNTQVEVTVTGTDNIAIGSSSFNINANSTSIDRDYPIDIEAFNTTLNAPTLLLPASGTVGVISGQTLSWENNDNAQEYELQISEQSDFSVVLESYLGSLTTYTPTLLLTSNTQYFWRVKSISDCGGESTYSNPFNFTTAQISCNVYANNQSIAIGDQPNTVETTINVTDHGLLQDIVVSLDISHTYIQDLTINLRSPAGTVVNLITQGCGDNDDIIATFDDEGVALSCGNNPGISGSISPEQSLSTFDGEQVAGNWTLIVIDSENEDGGAINSFGLNICVDGVFELDTDGDGVADSSDLCPGTPTGIDVDVTGCEIFALPSDNFLVKITSESCVGSGDGSISINALQALNYTATLSGGSNSSQIFTSETEFIGLSANNYSVCITVSGETDYQQCFDIVITSPETILVESRLDYNNNSIELTLQGGNIYNIELNGIITQTTDNNITLALKKGTNLLRVTTNKDCQGDYEEEFFIEREISVYPNPFTSQVKLYVGVNEELINVTVYSILGEVVLSNMMNTTQNGEIVLELNKLQKGVYLVDIKSEGLNSSYKIIKQ